MVVTYQLRQVTTALDGPLYRVFQEIVAADNSEKEVFVYNTSTEAFSHVATIKDMRTWPTSRHDAQDAYLAYYRLVSLQRDWLTTGLMAEDVNVTAQRVQLLASALTDEAGLLEIDRTLELTGA